MFAPQHDIIEIEAADSVVDWALARCRDDAVAAEHGVASLTEVFFSEQIPAIAAAKRICHECPLIVPCLEGALDRREPWGVWGGQLFLNGKVLAHKRKRGRPPKNPQAQVCA